MSSETFLAEDLAKSGLVAQDIDARPIDSPERAMTLVPHSTQGYVIPYHHLDGRPLPFYRCRLQDFEPKYKQPRDTSTYVYFPKGFHALSKAKPYIILTEGEKKAALATKLGFPTCALGGVDGWRTRSLQLPSAAEFSQHKSNVQAKLPAGAEVTEDSMSSLAIGMQELIDYAHQTHKHVIILFDSDLNGHVKPQVQRAAASLGFELRFRGLAFNRIRQIILPVQGSATKVGLDDLLMQPNGSRSLAQLVDECVKKRSAFPQHPSIRDFINKRLQKPKLSRKETQAVAISILSDLDANGIRLRSDQVLQTYYFDQRTNALLRAEFDRQRDYHDSKFGQFMYKQYGLSSADSSLTEWLAAQFTGEEPVGSVSPFRVIARTNLNENSVIYQLSDSQYARVDSEKLTIHNNGESGILFEAEQVDAVDSDKLVQEFERQKSNSTRYVKPYWMETLSSVRLKDQGRAKQIVALMYYLSPWLYRWKGMQLPFEMIVGESGSGKSTLYELRLSVLTGQPRLRNSPQDLKDWHASIVNTGGLHVTDNVQLLDRNLRQRLSDEICRIVTEPTPYVEMRKYYTNADLIRIPVRAVFAITAIQQPFQNADLIQRSIITELDKLGDHDPDEPIVIRYDSEWRNDQLAKYNGREGWIAHHLLVLQRFFQLAQQKWNNQYSAHHRLINFEQSMKLMAEVIGMESDWIPEYLAGTTDRALSESDWTFEGLRAYAEYHQQYISNHIMPNGKANGLFVAQQVSDWATGQEDYQKCEILINARRLGRYMNQHKTMIASIIGIIDAGTQANRQRYKITRHKG